MCVRERAQQRETGEEQKKQGHRTSTGNVVLRKAERERAVGLSDWKKRLGTRTNDSVLLCSGNQWFVHSL